MTIYAQVLFGPLPLPNCSQTLGFKLRDYCPVEMRIHASFRGSEDFTNPAGHIQGGFLCAMLDDVMGPAFGFSLEPDQFAPTLELKTQFLRPAYPGNIDGKAHVVSKGKRVCFIEGT